MRPYICRVTNLSLGIWPSACPLDQRKALAPRCPVFTRERLATFAADARLEMLDRKVSAMRHFRLQKGRFFSSQHRSFDQ
jgi:hypothetical protein